MKKKFDECDIYFYIISIIIYFNFFELIFFGLIQILFYNINLTFLLAFLRFPVLSPKYYS